MRRKKEPGLLLHRERGFYRRFTIGRREFEIKLRVAKPIALSPRDPDELDKVAEYVAEWRRQHPDWKPMLFSTGARYVPWFGQALTPEYEGQDPAERRANETARSVSA